VKTGVLTFHRCINYGSYWQARCLVEGLRAAGHDAVILDHASPLIDRAEWRCALQPTLPVPTPPSDRPHYRRKVRRFFEAFEALPLSPRFPIDKPAHAGEFDLVVVGSDEVWNLAHPWYAWKPLFYGHGLSPRRLVSYAASFGHQDPAGELPMPWSGWLRAFHHVTVRDDVSRSIVERATGRHPPIVLDPCLQFPQVGDATTTAAPADAPYVAVYGHGFSAAFAAGVRAFARERGLRVASIGYRNGWADEQWLDAGPLDFPGLIANAAAVATNFFHGCVFALRHGRPFACESSWYRSNKVRSLMTQLGTGDRLLGEGAGAQAFAAALGHPPGIDVIERIERQRRASQRVLDELLAPKAAAA
jgi:hypothetical protein